MLCPCYSFSCLDVLYKKTQHKPNKDFIRLVNECESNTKNVSITEGEDCFEEEERNIAVPLASNLQDVVQKVRKIVKLFWQSPVKNDDHLQSYILENLGREKMLLLGCKMR